MAGPFGGAPQLGAGAPGRFIRARTTERPSGSASTCDHDLPAGRMRPVCRHRDVRLICQAVNHFAGIARHHAIGDRGPGAAAAGLHCYQVLHPGGQTASRQRQPVLRPAHPCPHHSSVLVPASAAGITPTAADAPATRSGGILPGSAPWFSWFRARRRAVVLRFPVAITGSGSTGDLGCGLECFRCLCQFACPAR